MKVRSSREVKREIKRISEGLSKHRRELESSILVVVGEGSKMIWEGDVVGGERDSPERGFVGFGPPQNTVISKKAYLETIGLGVYSSRRTTFR